MLRMHLSLRLIVQLNFVWCGFTIFFFGSVRKLLLGFLAVLAAFLFYLWLLQYCQLVVFSPYVETSFQSQHSCNELKF